MKLVLLLAFVIACGSSKPTTDPAPTSTPTTDPAPSADPKPSACPDGQSELAHGCGGGPAFETGCYAKCTGGAACPEGTTCTQVTINPCHGSMCDACGAPAELCLPGT